MRLFAWPDARPDPQPAQSSPTRRSRGAVPATAAHRRQTAPNRRCRRVGGSSESPAPTAAPSATPRPQCRPCARVRPAEPDEHGPSELRRLPQSRWAQPRLGAHRRSLLSRAWPPLARRDRQEGGCALARFRTALARPKLRQRSLRPAPAPPKEEPSLQAPTPPWAMPPDRRRPREPEPVRPWAAALPRALQPAAAAGRGADRDSPAGRSFAERRGGRKRCRARPLRSARPFRLRPPPRPGLRDRSGASRDA